MKCKYCGTELPNGIIFCPNCGKYLSNRNKCFKCGEFILDDADSCPHCGAEQPVYGEEWTNRKWIWGIATLWLIAAVAGGYYYMSNRHSNAKSDIIPTRITTSDSTDNKKDMEFKTPSFRQLIQFYEKGIAEASFFQADDIFSRLKDMGLDQLYLKERTEPNVDEGTHEALDIVYGKNVRFEVLSYDDYDKSAIASSKITPTQKNHFAIELIGVCNYDSYLFDDMVVFVGNQNLWNQLKKEALEYGIKQNENEGENSFTFDGPNLVFVYFTIKDGEYVITFSREH